MIAFTVFGSPIAKKRPRFTVRGGHARAFNSQETEEGRLLWELRQQYRGEPLDGPVFVEMEFYFEPPASASKKARKAMLDGELAHVKKPDLDNLLKFYFDVMNGHVWIDDCQVVDFVARKAYAERAMTVIKVRKLGAKYAQYMVQPTDF